MILNASNLNDAKKLGRSKKVKDILDIFTCIEEQGFGIRFSDWECQRISGEPGIISCYVHGWADEISSAAEV